MVTDIVKAFQKDIAKRKVAKKSSSSKRKTYGIINGQTITAIQTKRNGSKIYYSGSRVVRELNPQGISVARVQVSTSGLGGRKTPTKTPSQQMQQQIKETQIKAMQQKAKAKAISQGQTAKQQMAIRANQQFLNKVEQSIKLRNTQASEARRKELFSLSGFSGQKAKIITQGVIAREANKNLSTSPFSPSVKAALKKSVSLARVDPKAYKFGVVTIGNFTITPTTLKEKKFYDYAIGVEKRNKKLQSSIKNSFDRAGITQAETAGGFWLQALTGLVKLGVITLYTPKMIANALDNAIVETRASLSKNDINTNLKRNLRLHPLTLSLKIPKSVTDGIANKITGLIKGTAPSERIAKTVKETRSKQIKTSLTEVGKSFDPRKPANWANIISLVAGMVASGVKVRSNLSKLKSNYIPSKRGIATIETGVSDILKSTPEMKRQYSIRLKGAVSRREKTFYKRQINKIARLEKTAQALKKRMKFFREAEKKGIMLSVIDMNPLIKTAELLKLQGKNRYLFHATTTKIKQAFKAGKVDLISATAKSKVLTRIRKKTFTPRRMLSASDKYSKALVSFFRRTGGIVGGGKAQNVFVRRMFRRRTIDYDVFYRNHKTQANKALVYMRRKFPKANIELVILKIPNSKLIVYRLKVNGKELADFDSLPKDLGVPVKVGKDIVASPEFLAKRKLSTQADVQKFKRVTKDKADLKRLLGRRFSSKDFVTKISSPRNVLKVLPQPRSMGKSRLAFRETQLFFDTEVSIGYAVNNLIKPRFKTAVGMENFLRTVTGRKTAVGELAKLKTFKRGAKGVIIRLEADISRFPPKLLSRVKKSAKGLLSLSERTKLRKDIVTYLDNPKNLQKASIGSRTASLTKGEREIVVAELSNLYKKTGKSRFTRDPNTGLYSEIIDVTLKQTKPTSKAGRILTRLKNKVKVFTPKQLKLRFSKGNLIKLRRYKKLLRLKAELTDPQYRDLLYFLDSMMSDKRGTRSLTKDFSLKAVKAGRKRTTRSSIRLSKTAKAGKLLSGALARKVVRAKPKVRKAVRVRTRVISRSKTRPRVTPRLKVKTRVRPRPTARTLRLTRMPKRITFILKKRKKVSSKDKKELLEYVKKSKAVYRPSLAALIFNITSYKIPKSVNPFDIRPLVVKLRERK